MSNPYADNYPVTGSGRSTNPDTSPPKGNAKTQQIQNQVNEVVGIMQQNIDSVMQRGERLDTIQNKTQDLQQSSVQFQRGASRVRKAMWWKDLKWKIIIGGTIVALLLIIIVPIIVQASKK